MKQNIKIAKQLLKLADQLISEKNLMNATNIKKELEKVHISEYLPFIKIHMGEWISYPINRNSNLPDIYVYFKDGKVTLGYNYLDENIQDYQSAEQDSITGMIEELAIIKTKLKDIIVNVKNDNLNKKEQQKKEETSEEDTSLEQENTSLEEDTLLEQEDTSLEEDTPLKQEEEL